jgi:hypothetical protein
MLKNKHLRTAPAAVTYTETFCQDCKQVINLGWEQQHHNITLSSKALNSIVTCSMCGGSGLVHRVISQQDFEEIVASWDLMAAGEIETLNTPNHNEQDNIVDLSAWFEAGSCAASKVDP